jgi:hypothetical protein
MNFNIFIPQIFYDLIGRLIPGFIILVLACILLIPLGTLEKYILQEHFPATFFFFIVLLFSYFIGAVLGGLWFGYLDKKNDKKIRSDHNLAKLLEIMSFKYDVIQYYRPDIGARLAKLRSERHFCGVIQFGSWFLLPLVIINFIAYCNQNGLTCPGLLLLFLFIVIILLSFFGAKYFGEHVESRSLRLMENNFKIICMENDIGKDIQEMCDKKPKKRKSSNKG